MRQLFIIIALLVAIQSYSQVTTETEYKYIKNLMREIDEKGADPKRGYYVTDLVGKEWTDGDNLVAKELRREADNTVAGTYVKITIVTALLGSGTFYFCIPAPNLVEKDSYGWNDFYEQLNTSGNTCKDAFLRWITYEYSKCKYNLHKTGGE